MKRVGPILHRHKHRLAAPVMAVILILAATATATLAAKTSGSGIHFIGEPVCTVQGDQVVCSGSLAGVGTAPTVVEVDVAAGCANKPGHEPPGHATGSTGPIQPRGGRINFNTATDPLDCPPGLTEVFGDTATINVFQGGNLVFSADIPIT
jgi:hypothetical protein